MSYTEQDRICVPVPFYHCFGMVMGNLASTSHGACIVIPAPGFDPAATLRAVQDEKCTSLYGVPTMFIAELALPDFATYDLSSLRTGCMAGSPCPVEVMKRVMELMHMREVSIAYGMTETSPVSTQTAPDDPVEKRVGSVGRVHPWVEVKVIDPGTGEAVERGEAGAGSRAGAAADAGSSIVSLSSSTSLPSTSRGSGGCERAGRRARAAGAPSPSSAMMRLIEERMSSIDGSALTSPMRASQLSRARPLAISGSACSHLSSTPGSCQHRL